MLRSCLILLTASTLLLGCDDESAAPAASPSAAGATATATAQTYASVEEHAAALAKQVSADGTLPSAVAKDSANAWAFVHLVATSKETNVVVAALKGMLATFVNPDAKVARRVNTDASYDQAVLAKLDDPDPRVQGYAIRAAGVTISGTEPNRAIVSALTRLSAEHPKPEGRMAALSELWRARGLEKEHLAPYVAALDAEQTWLVTMALLRLKGHAARMAEKELLREKATALLGHADPGVRGRAAELLAAAADDGDEAKQAVAMLLLPLLKDTHPATRSHAVLALAWLGHPGAVHELMPLIADRTKDRYVLSGFKHLSGDPGEIEHGGEGTVGQTVLFALQRLAVHTDEKLAYRLRRDGSAEDRASAEAQAKAWYDKMKAKLPRLPASAKKDAGEAKH